MSTTIVPLTWLTASAPLSHFDAISRKLWKLLTAQDPKDIFSGQPREQRELIESDSGTIWRYVYVDATSQVILFEDRTPQGELLRELFCVPSGTGVACGARLPKTCAESVCTVFAEAGKAQAIDPINDWPSLSTFRRIVADAAAEEQLEDTPVASLVAERDYLAAQLANANEALRHSRFENRSLKAQLGTTEEPLLDESKAYPDSLDKLGDWVKQYSSRMLVAERAIRGAKKSQYRDPEVVFQCLEHLATSYWEMKTGKISVAAHEAALTTLSGVSLRGSAGVSVAGEQGEAYFISHKGRRLFLDLHLAKGGGFDQRYCMRVYFTWLPDEQRVLVGDLPAHLANSLS